MKTLKDIAYTRGKGTALEHRIVVEDTLKQEAIKWIYHLNNIEQELSKNIKLADNNTYKAQIDWIKHFFNITDEELK